MSGQLRALIVDDEPLARQGMRNRLRKFEDVAVVHECEDGYQAVDSIQALDPDVVFLDVQMPGLDGFGVLRSLEGTQLPPIIFVTAYDEFAIRAFRMQAVDYLVKPIDDDELADAIERARQRLRGGVQNLSFDALSSLLRDYERATGGERPVRYMDRLQVRQNARVLFIRTETIARIESADNYMRVYSSSGTFLIRSTMRDIEQRLDPQMFVRIHRQTIVNLDHVREVSITGSGDYVVVMQDRSTHRVGRLYREALLERGV